MSDAQRHDSSSAHPRRPVGRVLVALLLVVVLAAAGGVWWFLSGDAPPEVSLDAAGRGVTAPSTSGRADGATAGHAGADGVEGTWAVDTSSGSFDFESATGTFAGFRVEEKLANIGAATAVGRTGDVSGTVEISGTTLRKADITIDMSTITTNESRRDAKVQQALDTQRFPQATFVLSEPTQLGPDAASGHEQKVTATGDLTIHGVTKRVGFPLEAKLVKGTIVVVGSLDIVFSDYGVETPSSPVVLSVEDHGTIELQLLMARS